MARAPTDVPIKCQPGTVISAVPAPQCKDADSTHPLSQPLPLPLSQPLPLPLPLPLTLPLPLSLTLPLPQPLPLYLTLPLPLSMPQATGHRPASSRENINIEHEA